MSVAENLINTSIKVTGLVLEGTTTKEGLTWFRVSTKNSLIPDTMLVCGITEDLPKLYVHKKATCFGILRKDQDSKVLYLAANRVVSQPVEIRRGKLRGPDIGMI